MAKTIRTTSIRVDAGKQGDLDEVGNFVIVQELPVAGSSVTIKTSGGDDVTLREGEGAEFAVEFNKLYITNNAGVVQAVTLGVGYGRIVTTKVQGVVQVEPASSSQDAADVVVADGGTVAVLAANPNRTAAVLQITNASAGALARAGAAPAAGRGREMSQGIEYTFTHEGEIRVHAPAGGGAVTVAVYEELK